MVNRVMFQKLLKLNKQRRQARRYVIHVPKTPNRILMDGYREHAAGGLHYQEFTATGTRMSFTDMVWLDRNFAKIAPPRAEQTLNLVNNLISNSTATMNTNIVNQKYLKVKMFFNMEWDCIFFVQYQPLINLLKISVTYGRKDRALLVAGYDGEEIYYNNNTIRWKEEIFIAGVENTPSG